MDKATRTMIENLHKNTGKTLQQWIEIVKKKLFKTRRNNKISKRATRVYSRICQPCCT
jgi:hypothetical protein